MRWPAYRRDVPPRDGDTRWMLRFAWLPTCVRGEVLWLSWYEEHERFYETADGGFWLPLDRRIAG